MDDFEVVRYHHTAKDPHSAKKKHPAKGPARTVKKDDKKRKTKAKTKVHHDKQRDHKHEKLTRYGEKYTAKAHDAGATKKAKTAKAAHLPHNGTAHHEQYVKPHLPKREGP